MPRPCFKLTFLCVLLLSAQYYAQDKKCPLITAPELRGFKLGQKLAGVREVHPYLKYPPVNEIGMVDPVIVEGIKDVRHVILRFMDSELKSIEVFYDEQAYTWPSVNDFVLRAAQGLKLPNTLEDWGPGGHRRERALKCSGFIVMAGLVDTTTYIKLQSAGYDEEVTRRMLEVRRRKQETFKP